MSCTPRQVRAWLAVQAKLQSDAVRVAGLRMHGSKAEREAVAEALDLELLRIMTTPPPFDVPEPSEACRRRDALLRRAAEGAQAADDAETERLQAERDEAMAEADPVLALESRIGPVGRVLAAAWFEHNMPEVEPWNRTLEDYAKIDFGELAADPSSGLTQGEREWAFVAGVSEKLQASE